MQRLQRGISGRIPRIYGTYVRETPLDFLLLCVEYV